MSRSVSVVVPVYNGSRSIDELVDRLVVVLGRDGTCDLLEVILVDDASNDDSWRVIQGLAERCPAVRGIALARNAGQHAALLAGIAATGGDVVVTMDDDLQHRPEDVPALVRALGSDVDLVYGRSVVEEHGVFRNVSSRVAKGAIAAAAGSEIARLSSGFRCFPGHYRAALTVPRGPYISLDVLLSWVSRRVVAVPVTMEPRRYGTSNYSVSRLARHALNMLFGFSTAPLRVISVTGFVVALLGLGLLLFVLVRWAIGDSGVPGFAFLASMVALFSGFQILTLGILGEYFARMYATSLRRPAYVIRSATDPDSPSAGT